MTKKYYTAIVDQLDKQGRFWCSGARRKLTDEQAKPLLKKGRIVESDIRPKKFVLIIEPNGVERKMTWGEYLKRRRRK